MLKLALALLNLDIRPQPPSGGCVLKQSAEIATDYVVSQPPSGGCVLKHFKYIHILGLPIPAAFRRLCVETGVPYQPPNLARPAAFRRLCVETRDLSDQD